jgi:ATP-dependent Clp protease protease subunit
MELTVGDYSQLIANGICLPDRTLYLDGSVNEDMAKRVVLGAKLLGESGGTLKVFINTGGGDLTDGLAIYDALVRCPAKVTTICSGRAYSMGSLLMQAGSERLITPNSWMMLHPLSMNLPTDYLEYQRVEVGMVEQLARRYASLVAPRMGIKPKDFWKTFGAGATYFDAGQALRAGLVDGVYKNDN